MSRTPRASGNSGSKSPAPVTVTNARIGFLGAGKLAESIINGLVVHGKVDPKRIYVAAPSKTNTDRLKQIYQGLTTNERNFNIFTKFRCDIIFLALNGSVVRYCFKIGGTKPAFLCTNYIPNVRKHYYVLSLITGYSLATVRQLLVNPDRPDKYFMEMHRIVMNCATAYGMGMCYVDVEPDSSKLALPVRALLSLVAQLEYLPESQMDAACAVCGAGLAFAYYFISAMSDGALKVGLSRVAAVKFVAKTVSCAMNSLLVSDKLPNELKDEVCAPSAGAIYGLSMLDKAEVNSAVTGAIEAAHKRALSLANEDPQ